MAHTKDLDRMESNLGNVFSRDSESREAAPDVSIQLVDWTEKVGSLKREHAILQSLQFDKMITRRNDTANAEPDIFQWVEKSNLSFLEWLFDGDGVCWVTIDPGSGKSTLMKYLSHNKTTQEKLEQWAAPKTLVRASFYFWFLGTNLQKSQEGLLQSLLFEILRQCPYLIPRVCQSRWSSDLTVPWHKSELMETLKSLTLETTSHKFFFLIDGLDEYQDYDGLEGGKEGEVATHISDIIRVIKDLAKVPEIKLCVSRRPWPAFEKAFG